MMKSEFDRGVAQDLPAPVLVVAHRTLWLLAARALSQPREARIRQAQQRWGARRFSWTVAGQRNKLCAMTGQTAAVYT